MEEFMESKKCEAKTISGGNKKSENKSVKATDSEKLLNEKLLQLLSKNNHTEDEKIEIFNLVVEHCKNLESLKNNEMFKIEIQETTDLLRPIAQVGFCVTEKGEFSHLITVNREKIKTFPIARIVLVACHECGHLSKNNKFAKTLDFSKKEDIERYIAKIRRKHGDWYHNEEEIQADIYGFETAKNVYQRAVHDTPDVKLKEKFWSEFDLIEYNQNLEMEKHKK
jgi:hypothetical protein